MVTFCSAGAIGQHGVVPRLPSVRPEHDRLLDRNRRSGLGGQCLAAQCRVARCPGGGRAGRWAATVLGRRCEVSPTCRSTDGGRGRRRVGGGSRIALAERAIAGQSEPVRRAVVVRLMGSSVDSRHRRRTPSTQPDLGVRPRRSNRYSAIRPARTGRSTARTWAMTVAESLGATPARASEASRCPMTRSTWRARCPDPRALRATTARRTTDGPPDCGGDQIELMTLHGGDIDTVEEGRQFVVAQDAVVQIADDAGHAVAPAEPLVQGRRLPHWPPVGLVVAIWADCGRVSAGSVGELRGRVDGGWQTRTPHDRRLAARWS